MSEAFTVDIRGRRDGGTEDPVHSRMLRFKVFCNTLALQGRVLCICKKCVRETNTETVLSSAIERASATKNWVIGKTARQQKQCYTDGFYKGRRALLSQGTGG
jgi:hypothetical protein